jgi:Tfp pilus assembly protein PilN
MSVESERVVADGTTAATATSPRRVARTVLVNLIPPEIAAAKRLRSVQFAVGGGALAVVAMVAALYVQQGHQVDRAKAQLTSAQVEGTRLQAEQTRLGDVNALYAKVDVAKAMLARAKAPQVLWSTLLQDLRLTLPEKTWLTSVALTETGAATTSGTSTPSATTAPRAAAAAATATSCAPVGTLTASGGGYTHADVADWLDRLAGLRSVSNPYLTSSTEALVGTVPTVAWTTTGSLDCRALASAGGK